MQKFIVLVVVFGTGLLSWTVSWADMEEIVTILTSDAPEEFGHTLANAGDVNGDGFDDLVVGNHVKWSGCVYIYFGGPSFDTIPDLTLVPRENIRHFGYNVAGAGDVNHDGFSDFMVAAGNEEIDRGFVYIFHGGSPMDTVPDVVIFGKASDVGFGWAISHTGDLNDDGYDDVIVGAPEAPNDGYGKGKAYIYHGGAPMDTIPDLVLRHNTEWSYFGTEVRALGDVNGDGYPDIAVGHTWWNYCTGRAYLYFGGPDMDRVPEVILSGETAYSHFGEEIAGVDLNRDGYPEIVVGASTYGDGRIYIYRGGPGMDPVPDLIMSGRWGYEELGRRVTGVGDLDGDGYDDFTSGTYHRYGRMYAYYGGKLMDRDIDLVLPDVAGGEDDYGNDVEGFDIDNDGTQELIVGSPKENKVYLYRIEHDRFTIDLKPDTRKVEKGAELGWTATITNNTEEAISLYFWVDLLDPNALPYGDGPVLGPKLKKIPSGKTITRHISMDIPGDPSLGQYTCTLKADTSEPQWPWLDFIENDSFEFQLVSEMRGFDHPSLSRLLRKR
jgi:hypothetical protein